MKKDHASIAVIFALAALIYCSLALVCEHTRALNDPVYKRTSSMWTENLRATQRRRLLDDLHSPIALVRMKACDRLGTFGSTVADALIERFFDDHPTVRKAAACALITLVSLSNNDVADSNFILNKLLPVLQSPNQLAQITAVWYCGRTPTTSRHICDHLTPLLRHPNAGVRVKTAWALAMMRLNNERIWNILAHGLVERDNDMVCDCLEGILALVTDSNDAEVQEAARSNRPRLIPLVIPLMQIAKHPDDFIRLKIVSILRFVSPP